MASFHRLFGTLAIALAFTFAGCTSSDNLATKGQLIECEVAADGSTSNCTPVDQPSGTPGTCVDHDDDGDGDAHDEAEAEDDDDNASVTGDTDDDDDGTSDEADDDDDNDGIDDDQDCDELPGGDDDDSDD